MFDFRLKVFFTVAKRLNFTKASEELYITQPAVTKHIKEIENYFKVKLFDRNGTKIKLTPAGETLLQYSEQLFSIYQNMEFDLNAFTQNKSGTLRIGASTTAAQYLLPPILAAFHRKFDKVKVQLVTGNTEQIEIALQNKNIDLGIIEGKSRSTLFKYSAFIKDELVLVAKNGHSISKKSSVKVEDLIKYSFLLREPGSGTLEVIAHALKQSGIKISNLNLEMQLDSSESIKMYLLNSEALAFLSIYSIFKELKNNECTVVEVKGLSIEREFNFIQNQGDSENLSDLFMRFAISYNFR
ncbi:MULTISPECIES: LysR family transcriptional regulator [Flavobacteriales]|jgi:DNA-binding transcriptional LysR family regulator|uniref:LysR family transcriptional regulator n=2 Tax=Chryseobacterium TaxID=59732 RepID=A0AAJ1VI86_9FLAO|nr:MULTISPECIES: LysR family transcriptional regulator [Flavobacteriales]MBF6645677.1 LysR family transcriptional regulator [Chryseobacterium indologenes]MBU3049847.1 LysR family transcriptional regulator [Chryseobacterium indologenes]MDN4011330.1 LysR family transcriptional regulator [Chryseobacterium gambrini]NML59267.1 LysR family transcriptional regulator [Chryseobacterium cheonjiense]QQQ70651.1 LysR family transcriptional regulator [Chryseobacterium indologenes]